MAFNKYTDDITGGDVLDHLTRAMTDLESAMDQAETVAGWWGILAGTRTDLDIATQLFGDGSQPNLDKVTDIKAAIGALVEIGMAVAGDNTVVIPVAPGNWSVTLRKFA